MFTLLFILSGRGQLYAAASIDRKPVLDTESGKLAEAKKELLNAFSAEEQKKLEPLLDQVQKKLDNDPQFTALLQYLNNDKNKSFETVSEFFNNILKNSSDDESSKALQNRISSKDQFILTNNIQTKPGSSLEAWTKECPNCKAAH